jgi:hypothetical protein
MSTKIVTDQLQSAAQVEAPKEPGAPGMPIASEMQKELHRNHSAQGVSVDNEKDAIKAYEKASGKKLEDMNESDFAKLDIRLVAKDQQLRNDLTVILKDKSMAARWINNKAGGGRSLNRALSMGFTMVERSDIEYAVETNYDSATGALQCHDVICMKIPKIKLFGQYYKDNEEKARVRLTRQGLNQGNLNANLTISGGGAAAYQG